MPWDSASMSSGLSLWDWMMSMAVAAMSMPSQRRPSLCAATTAVPQPQNGSSTRSSSLLDMAMIRSRSFSGFCVSYPRFSFECAWILGISVHTLFRDFPFCSSR